MRIAAFIDLQGTLGGDSHGDIRSLDFYPYAIDAIKRLNDIGVLVIGITNQSRIADGALTFTDYENKLRLLKDELLQNDAHFDAVYCCPHNRSENCLCKKPKTGMINFAKKDFGIDINNSFVIGDMGVNDMLLAKNAGAKGILVLTGAGNASLHEYRHTWKEAEPVFIAENVLEAANFVVSDMHNK